MGKKEKLISKIESQPYPTDVSFEELKKYLGYFGLNETHRKGSHVQFKSESGKRRITLVSNQQNLKVAYIIEAVKTAHEEE